MARLKYEEDKLYPGTLSADEWLEELATYQVLAGWGALPEKPRWGKDPLQQWVQRMRRMANAGRLSLSLAMHLARRGILLGMNHDKKRNTDKQAEAAFERNMQNLRIWMNQQKSEEANITYAETRADLACQKCYTFLEHMRLKQNQMLLSNLHREELIRLPLRINGKPIDLWLDEACALRDDALGTREPVTVLMNTRMKLLTVEETEEHFDAYEGALGVIYMGIQGGVVPVKFERWRVLPLDVGGLRLKEREMLLNLENRAYRFFEDGPGAPVIVFDRTSNTFGVLAIRDVPAGCIGVTRTGFHNATTSAKLRHPAPREPSASI